MAGNNGQALKSIKVRGAKLHNLKNIDVDIPRNSLTVITGVSGSGKSSLAFDTIYAEGQRRFVQSLSSYARQFLERMAKPDVDSIDGLPPAIAIEQRPSSKNPRSTVGTSTEIYDYLRLLFGRVGTTYCHKCGEEVKKDSPNTIVNKIMDWPEGEKVYITFPFKPGNLNMKDALAKLSKKGFFRIVLKKDGKMIDLENESIPRGTLAEDILVLVDRMAIRHDSENRSRMHESVESALIHGDGRAIIHKLKDNSNNIFTTKFECASCEILYYEPEPRLFSFNDPYGACPNCQGFGRTIGIDLNLVFPDKSKSIKNGAIHPFRSPGHAKFNRQLIKEADKIGFPVDIPVSRYDEKQMEKILNGFGKFEGVYGFFSMLEDKMYKVQNRVMLSRYRGYTKCTSCNGSRLRTSARQVYVGGKNIPELIIQPLEKLLEFVKSINLTEYQRKIVAQVLRELEWRLQLLVDIGLDYLTLERLTHTLSGGEAQRINLSTALGSSLVGTLFVLDEPSIGMHQRDTDRLIKILKKIRDLGNTVVVVEHDPDIIREADYILDLGPKAGEYGGEIIYSGNFYDMLQSKKSLTGQYISGKMKLKIPKKRVKPENKVTVLKPRQHNLNIEKAEFPLGCMTVVTGVSGSGKSTLVHDILYAGLKKLKGGFNGMPGAFEKINGSEYVEHIEMVDQSPIGKSRRSTPATYVKVFDHIRELFSHTQAAKQLGWKPGHFSFNVPGGRCDVCDGEGAVQVDMQFLPDIQLECEACKGTRYKKEVRNILYKGKSVVDVLSMSVDEALKFFEGVSKITKKLQILHDVGLGYLRLGQPSTILSGGESQRIKLAGHLDTHKISNTLFIFDEPTTGLHLDDISKLNDCFRRLVKQKHSVVIIEHNMHVIASADWIIDLGPEAGERGGLIVAQGKPEDIAKNKRSYTGMALKEFFG